MIMVTPLRGCAGARRWMGPLAFEVLNGKTRAQFAAQRRAPPLSGGSERRLHRAAAVASRARNGGLRRRTRPATPWRPGRAVR